MRYYWRVHSLEDPRFDLWGTADGREAVWKCLRLAVLELVERLGTLPRDLDRVCVSEDGKEVFWSHESIIYEGTAMSHLHHHPYNKRARA